MKQKIIIYLKIFFIYWLMILASIILSVLLHMPVSLIIFLPLSIILSNKYTEKDRLKLRELNAIKEDMDISKNIIQKICNSKKALLYSKKVEPDSNSENINYYQYYKPKRYIVTINELHFYEVLLEIAKELDLILFSQVSLYSIVEPRDNLDYSTRIKYLNKINRKSIDFVLVDKSNCRIIKERGIESFYLSLL